MKNALTSELLKIRTMRATYIWVAISLLLAGFISFYALGMRAAVDSLSNPLLYQQTFRDIVSGTSLFGVIVCILIFTSEYSFNTITYTLTSTNSRLKVLAAKIAAASIFAVLFTLMLGALSLVALWVGLKIKNYEVVAQTFYVIDLIKVVFTVWASLLFGLMFAALIRSTAGTIVAYLLVPTTVESLLRLVLKDNVKYLPFTALSSVTSSNPAEISLRPGTATLLVAMYLIFGWLIAGYLFLRRDAN